VTALRILKERDSSNKIPQKIAGNDSAHNRAAVTAGGDDFVEMFDLQAVVEGVTNAMGGVEERERAENEEVDAHEGKREKGTGAGVFGGFGESEGAGDSEDEEVNGNQKCGDDTAGAEEEPQKRLDAEFGGLRVHLVFYPH